MSDHDLLDFAPLVGLDALDADELAELERAVAAAPDSTRRSFDAEVRRTREAMAQVSANTAAAPPPTLRDRVLAATDGDTTDETTARSQPPAGEVIDLDSRRASQRVVYAAAAAVVAVAIGAVGWAIGSQTGTEPPLRETVAEEVFGAEDVQTRSGAVATGTASVTFSDSADAGVLVMNNVPPPQPGTVYQMWLVGPDDSMTSAGTMTESDVAPSTTAVLTGIVDARALAFTVEPPGGSAQPTSDPVAELLLD